jgi:hypothetical protein
MKLIYLLFLKFFIFSHVILYIEYYMGTQNETLSCTYNALMHAMISFNGDTSS